MQIGKTKTIGSIKTKKLIQRDCDNIVLKRYSWLNLVRILEETKNITMF